MAKAIFSALLFGIVCSVAAEATPSAESHRHVVTPAHTYWLSADLNRLAIWQAPASRTQ